MQVSIVDGWDVHIDQLRVLCPTPDFPRTLDQRVYHLGLRAGEVANRIVSFSPPASRILLLRYAD